MYEVIESLKNVESVVLFDEKCVFVDDLPFQNPLFCPIGKPEEVEPLTAESEFSDYNNIVVSWDTGELIIFQDYGEEQVDIPEGYRWVDRRIAFPEEHPSLGYYKGWFVWVDILSNKLRVQYLFKAELPDLDDLNWKRPYSFYLLEKEKELYYYVYLRFNERENSPEFLVKSPMTYDDVFSVENLNKVISWTNWFIVDMGTRLTRDHLVYHNFNYNDGTWKKGEIEIEDNGAFSAVERKFYYKGKEIIFSSDLNKIMKEELDKLLDNK